MHGLKIERFSFQEPWEFYKHVGQLLEEGTIISCYKGSRVKVRLPKAPGALEAFKISFVKRMVNILAGNSRLRTAEPPRAFGKRPRALKWLEGASKSCKTRFCSNFGLKKKPLNLQNL